MPSITGVIASVEDAWLALRLDSPAPGVAVLAAYACGGPVMASAQLYFYGEDAPAVVEREEPRWRAFMQRHFPAAAASEANS
jgi:hypothetical protein